VSVEYNNLAVCTKCWCEGMPGCCEEMPDYDRCCVLAPRATLLCLSHLRSTPLTTTQCPGHCWPPLPARNWEEHKADRCPHCKALRFREIETAKGTYLEPCYAFTYFGLSNSLNWLFEDAGFCDAFRAGRAAVTDGSVPEPGSREAGGLVNAGCEGWLRAALCSLGGGKARGVWATCSREVRKGRIKHFGSNSLASTDATRPPCFATPQQGLTTNAWSESWTTPSCSPPPFALSLAWTLFRSASALSALAH
jgi:hypothetical protein